MSVELPVVCPSCGRVNELHGGPRAEDVPEDGDCGICWGCRALYIFVVAPGGALAARPPTTEERAEYEASDQVRRARAAMAEAYYPLDAIALTRLGADQEEDPT